MGSRIHQVNFDCVKCNNHYYGTMAVLNREVFKTIDNIAFMEIRYAILHIKDTENYPETNVEKTGGRNTTWDDFVTDLRVGGPEECRYGVYDLNGQIICLAWIPLDTANDKNRNQYDMFFETLQDIFQIQKFVKCFHESELTLESVQQKL